MIRKTYVERPEGKHQRSLTRLAETMGPVWWGPDPIAEKRWKATLASGLRQSRLPQDLREHGSCQFIDRGQRDRFFVGEAEPNSPSSALILGENQDLWIEYCKDCPVLSQCFDYAMQYEDYGIWAGTTANDRFLARSKPERVEYGRNRALAGYVPYLPKGCVGCGVLSSGTECRKCAVARKRKGTLAAVERARAKGYTHRIALMVGSMQSRTWALKRCKEQMQVLHPSIKLERRYKNAVRSLEAIKKQLREAGYRE